MKEFAFYMSPYEMAYFGSIIKNLPKEFVDVHVGSLDGKISDFSALAAEYRKQIDQFAAEGYSVLPLNPDMLDNYRAAAMSTEFYGPATKLFDWRKTSQTRLAALVHSTYLPLDSNGFSANYYLLASRREAEHKELLKVLPAKNPRLFRKISALSRRMLNEYAWTGPYHFGEWLEKRFADKSQLRAELEEKLQRDLDPSKPVVAFLESWFNHPDLMKEGLTRLAPHVNLIIKKLTPLDIKGAYLWPENSFAPNLLRFASDFILASYRSGTLTSSTMLGLPVIPYYTPLVSQDWFVRSKWAPYQILMPKHFEGKDMCVDILLKINPPLDLLATDKILERMKSESWWDAYNKLLPATQKEIFGDYELEGAATKAARLLVRITGTGSFGKDIAALRLRPEFAKGIPEEE